MLIGSETAFGRSFCLAVPGLTRGADIKLNRRLPVTTSYKSDTHHPPGQFFPTSGPDDSGDHTPLAGFVLEHVQMNHYRVVTVDYDGKLSRHRGFVCDNDNDAIVWAKQLVDEAPVELWSGARFVTRLEPQSNTMAR
jgi:hypothetical protein